MTAEEARRAIRRGPGTVYATRRKHMRTGLENKGQLAGGPPMGEDAPKDMETRIKEVGDTQSTSSDDLLKLAVDLRNREAEAQQVASQKILDDIEARNLLLGHTVGSSQKEPIINANVIAGLVVGLLGGGGYTATQEELAAVEALLVFAITTGPVLVNLVAAMVARRKTTWIPK